MVREELWNKNNQQWGYKFRGLPLLCIVMWCNVVNLIINNPQQRGSWYFFVGVTMVYNINTPYTRRSIGTRCLAWIGFSGNSFSPEIHGFSQCFPHEILGCCFTFNQSCHVWVVATLSWVKFLQCVCKCRIIVKDTAMNEGTLKYVSAACCLEEMPVLVYNHWHHWLQIHLPSGNLT